MPENNSNRSRARKKRSVLYAPLSFIAICAVMIFGMSVFFRVSAIEVVGASQYTPEEIIEASGLEEGDNLFFINKFTAISNIRSRLPYVEQVSIDTKLPNRLVIEITESGAVACILVGNETWMLDRACKLLGTGTALEAQGKIALEGITPASPVFGEILRGESQDDAPKIEYAAAVLRELTERGMSSSVTKLDMSNVGSPSFSYLDRFVVRLGANESLGYKLDLLERAVEQLHDGDVGTIDLSGEGKAQFLPD